MLLIDIRSTNASAAEFILDRLKLYLAGRHHHHHTPISNWDFFVGLKLLICAHCRGSRLSNCLYK